jgi:Spy/CpxP family protein refolding chaperone
MKPVKYFVALLGLAAAAAMAQPPDAPQGPPPGGAHHGPPPGGGPGFAGPGNLDNLAILLDLDPYQKNEVQRVFTAQREAMRAERKEHAQGQRPTFEEMQAMRQQNEDAIVAQLKTVLSDTQITKLRILLDAPRGGPGPRGGRPGGPPPAGDAPPK